MAIKLADDTIQADDLAALSNWIVTNPQLTKGPLTIDIERKFAEMIGTKYAVFVNSGSSANMLMIYALIHKGVLKFNKKIVIPAISWATDLSPAIQFGLEPILCDCNLGDLSVDLNHLEQIFETEKPGALMLVSVLGMSPDMNKIIPLCEKHGVYLLEDNCESMLTQFLWVETEDLGEQVKASVQHRNLGTYGGMSSFSTFYGHHISTIEGGFITTDSRSDYELLCMLRSHGWSRDVSSATKRDLRERHAVDKFNELYTFYIPGFNVRNTEIGAFLGLRQLDKVREFILQRKVNADIFYETLINPSYFPTALPTFALPYLCKTPGHRNKLVERLKAEEIECRPLIAGNMANQPMYYKNCKPVTLPNANVVQTTGLYLPNHQGISGDDITRMALIVNEIENEY